MKSKFKKGDLLFYWNEGGHTDEIVIIIKVYKLSIGKYYYKCMFSNNYIKSLSENWLYKLEDYSKSEYVGI